MSTTVRIVPADVREVVAALAAYLGYDGVAVDAVVCEIDSRLNLIGEHPATTGLNWSTVMPWIAGRIGADLGAAEFKKILEANTISD